MDKPRLARRSLAERAANTVLRDSGISGLRVDPIAIASGKGITVKGKPNTAAGVSGMLLKIGDEFGILYATDIPSPGFQRFSIAHEIGHYCIEGHYEALLGAGIHTSYAGFSSSDPFEQEADYFAAALLMPERAFTRAIENHQAGLTCIDALSKACLSSMTATAIRYTTLTSDGVAVVLSKDGVVEWCFMSDGLKQAKGLNWLRKGTPVPGGTVTATLAERPDDVRAGRRESGDGRLNDWLDGERSIKAVEEAVGLGRYGRTLTVLTCPSLSQRADADEGDLENDDETLADRWEPRFR